MRGLNLSRLARSSEASYFSELQPNQAASLRKKLSASELETAKKAALEDAVAAASQGPTVDTVGTIAGQSAYRKIITSEAAATLQTKKPAKTYLMQQLQAIAANAPTTPAMRNSRLQATNSTSMMDPELLKAMGQSRRASAFQFTNTNSNVRSLPGSQRHAEATVVGIGAFAISTAIVGSIGGCGILYLYFNPSAVDAMQARTVRFRERLEQGELGKRLRSTSEKYRKDGRWFESDTAKSAHEFANRAVKNHGVHRAVDATAADERENDGQSQTETDLDRSE